MSCECAGHGRVKRHEEVKDLDVAAGATSDPWTCPIVIMVAILALVTKVTKVSLVNLVANTNPVYAPMLHEELNINLNLFIFCDTKSVFF